RPRGRHHRGGLRVGRRRRHGDRHLDQREPDDGPEARIMTARSRVLVVEDDPGIRELLREGLRHAGFEVIATATGREAEWQANRSRPDLVLLDVMLPDIDGLLLAERLVHAIGPVPVVFVTARDSTADKVAGLARGDDYVTKPFRMEELIARIQAVLRRSRGGGRAGRSGSRPPSSGSCATS